MQCVTLFLVTWLSQLVFLKEIELFFKISTAYGGVV